MFTVDRRVDAVDVEPSCVRALSPFRLGTELQLGIEDDGDLLQREIGRYSGSVGSPLDEELMLWSDKLV